VVARFAHCVRRDDGDRKPPSLPPPQAGEGREGGA
jgi:hypothetical protein